MRKSRKTYNPELIIAEYHNDPSMGYQALADKVGCSYTGARNAIINAGLKEEFESKSIRNPCKFMSKEELSKSRLKIAKIRKIRGTNKHSKATKEKISNSIRKRWEQSPWDTNSKSNSSRHKSGYYGSIYYRSSYELRFLKMCTKYGINIASCDSLKINFQYIKSNGRKGLYRPDFVDLDTGVIYEIKPESMLTYGDNIAKLKVSNATLITERDLE